MTKHNLLSLVMVGVALAASALTTGCTTGEPKVYTVDGVTISHTPKKFLGMTYATEEKEYKTKEQRLDDIDVAAEADKQNSEALRAKIAVWMGATCLAAAFACVVIGYLTHGWKRWGALAAICMTCGAVIWGFVEWIDHLKWLVVPCVLAVVLLFLYDNKDKGKDKRVK